MTRKERKCLKIELKLEYNKSLTDLPYRRVHRHVSKNKEDLEYHMCELIQTPTQQFWGFNG